MKRKIRRFDIIVAFLLLAFSYTPAGFANVTPVSFNLKVQADQLLKLGKIDQAIPLYERVLRQDPQFSNAYYNLATA